MEMIGAVIYPLPGVSIITSDTFPLETNVWQVAFTLGFDPVYSGELATKHRGAVVYPEPSLFT